MPYNLSGYTPYAFFQMPNSLEQRNCSIDGNVITVELDSYLLSVVGTIPFEIELHNAGEVTTTFRLYYIVEQSFDTDTAITTAPKWDMIEEFLSMHPETYVTHDEYEQAMVNVANGLPVDLTLYPKKTDISTVGTSGQYADLEGKPTKLSEFTNDLPKPAASEVLFTDGSTLQQKFDGKALGSGSGEGGGFGSGYGVIINGDNTDEIITASAANEILKVQGDTDTEGLASVSVIPKTSDSGSRDILKISSRFPSWEEIMGDPSLVFNNQDFVLNSETIQINPLYKGGGGGSGGGLPFFNVMQFSMTEKDPKTNTEVKKTYCAVGKSDPSTTTLEDGTVISDTVAFQKAFALAQAKTSDFPGGLGSVNIYIPDGIYILTETINIYRNTNVQLSRNAIIKKNHSGVMFANTSPNDAYVGYDGGMRIKDGKAIDPKTQFIPNNGNVFFDGGTLDNDTTSGSVFSLINAKNFEFKNMTIKDIKNSHAFDLCGIADIIIYNCNFLGFNYAGSATIPDATIPQDKLTAYSECIQLDYSSKEGYPYQITGHDGTACKRVRVDKCVFGASERYPAWNRVFGGHNTYMPTYDWLHNTDGTATGNQYNFLDGKPTDMYFLNNVIYGNGTLKYDYDPDDPQAFIIQQVRLQCVDNAIIMNNKFRGVKGGISIDIDQSPKTMLSDDLHKNFVLGAGTNVPKSAPMPAKVTYLDRKGDMQEILFSSDPADQDLSKITTHTHNNITYTIYWCKTTKMVDYYGWQNAMIMNNELTNITCGIFSNKQVTATTATSPDFNKLVVGDIHDTLDNQIIMPGTEIYYDAETNPRTVTNVVGTASTDYQGNPIQISPYTLTVYPSFTALPTTGKAIYIQDSPSKNASTPIYARGQSKPYSKVDATLNADGKTYTLKYGSAGAIQDPRGKKCIIYGNIVDGVDQIKVYSQYEDVITNGRKVTYIKTISADRLTLTLNALTDQYLVVGETIYYGLSTGTPNLGTPYQIVSVDTTAKKITLNTPIDAAAITGSTAYIWSRKPILAGETGGASIISAISTTYVWDILIQENIFKSVPRAIYHSGDTRMNIVGNHFYQINEVEAICINGGNYSSIIGNTFSDCNDQAIEMRTTNYFTIANNSILNSNKGAIFNSDYDEVDWSYNPLDNPVITVMGDGSKGKYGTITGNMLYHSNSSPIKTGIQADSLTQYIKVSNNSFPSQFTTRVDNQSTYGTDTGYRGNDADTLQGKSLDTLSDLYVPKVDVGNVSSGDAYYGVAPLGADKKVPSAFLPNLTSGSGFKTVTLTDIMGNIESLTANPTAQTLTLQGSGGIAFDTHAGNVLEIKYQGSSEVGNIGFDTIYVPGGESFVADGAVGPYFILDGSNGITTTVDPNTNTLTVHFDEDGIWAGKIFDKTATDLQTVAPNVEFQGAVKFDNTTEFDNTAEFKQNAKFDTTTEFVGKATFDGDAEFKSAPTFDTNVGFSKDVTLTRYEEKIGTVTTTSGTAALSLSTGNVFVVSPAGNTTISFDTTGFTYTGTYTQSIVLYIAMPSTIYALTFPSSVKWHNGVLPGFEASKTLEIVLRTKDSGTSWFASVGGKF